MLSLFNKASNPADTADKAAIVWLAVSNLPFTALECAALHALIEAARKAPRSWKLPSRKRAAGPLLASTLKEYERRRDDMFKGIGEGGATLASDSMKKCKKLLTQNVLCVPNAVWGLDLITLPSQDTKGNTKTGQFIAQKLIEIIEVVGDSRVTVVVMDGAANCIKAFKELERLRPRILGQRCAVHGYDLLLKDFSKIKLNGVPVFEDDLKEVMTVVALVMNNTAVYDLFMLNESALSLMHGAATRMSSLVIAVERFCRDISALQQVMASTEMEHERTRLGVTAKFKTGVGATRRIVNDADLHERLQLFLDVTQPARHALREMDSKRPNLRLLSCTTTWSAS